MKPFFVQEPSNVTALVGQSVELKCAAGGQPAPSILWRRTDGKMPIGRAKILDNKALRIEHVTPGDEGRYICDASSDVGSITAQAFLTVQCNYCCFITKR